MNDIIKCSKTDCNNLAIVVSKGLCFKHIKEALFG